MFQIDKLMRSRVPMPKKDPWNRYSDRYILNAISRLNRAEIEELNIEIMNTYYIPSWRDPLDTAGLYSLAMQQEVDYIKHAYHKPKLYQDIFGIYTLMNDDGNCYIIRNREICLEDFIELMKSPRCSISTYNATPLKIGG